MESIESLNAGHDRHERVVAGSAGKKEKLEGEMGGIEKDMDMLRIHKSSPEAVVCVSTTEHDVTLTEDDSSLTYSFSYLPKEVANQFVDGSAMTIQDVENILIAAMNIREQEVQALMRDSQNLNKVAEGLETLERREARLAAEAE